MENNKIIITDELVGAYLEGNTTPEETLLILQAIKNDPVLRQTLDLSMRIEEKRQEMELPMMQMAAESGENLCNVMCEAYIMRHRGMNLDEKALLDTARNNNWLKAQGTPLHSIGQLLAHEGIMVTRKYDANLDDITKALDCDNDIIIALDRDKLYPKLPDVEDAANHAVVVTAVNKEEGTVTLYDPPQPSPLSIAIPTFENAWKESKHYMVRALQSLEDYEPQPINLDDIPLTDDLMELQEAIAENAHEVWAAARMSEGWTYGAVRDDQKKQHPDLIPYSALPDGEKEYDRIMALNTIKLVIKLGFKIGR